MKATNKVHSVFTSKLSAILTKFKQSSTVHVGHEQLKTFFGDYAIKEIIVPFVTKMDTSDHLTEREKKEYTKVYIALVDCYKQKILADPYFEKLMQSLSKKTVGVSEAIAFVCKTLLNQIQEPENLFPFISIIISIFRNHTEIAKILKQLIEIIQPTVISDIQQEIISILHDKIHNAKNKNEFLETILALVLNLQEKLTVEIQIHTFLIKYLKHQDWNCRKTCVDIGNALLIINHEIAQNINRAIKELKYDKIKHVRESVNNYQILYKQNYSDEPKEKPIKHYTSFRETKIKSEKEKGESKSPTPVSQKSEQIKIEKSGSLEKVTKKKVLNENFFKNAKNSDVIKVGENQSCLVVQDKEQEEVVIKNNSFQIPEIKKTLDMVNEKANNFQAYLKNRNSPKQLSPRLNPQAKKQTQKKQSLFGSGKSSESKMSSLQFNYENQFDSFKKKPKQTIIESIKKDQFHQQSSSFSQDLIKSNENDISSLSFGQNNNILFEQFMGYLKEFQKRICDRFDIIEERIQHLEKEKNMEMQSSRMMRGRITEQKIESELQRQNSPRSFYYNETVSESQYESVQPLQSNLEQKIQISISNENWDEAFTIALTNNKKNILLNLLQRCVFPSDKTVQQCILLQIKKLLDYTSALKWLKFYLTQKTLSTGRLLKLKDDLLKKRQGDSKSYEMMKQLVLNQIAEKLDNLN